MAVGTPARRLGPEKFEGNPARAGASRVARAKLPQRLRGNFLSDCYPPTSLSSLRTSRRFLFVHLAKGSSLPFG
jgi:hypothetical protein